MPRPAPGRRPARRSPQPFWEAFEGRPHRLGPARQIFLLRVKSREGQRRKREGQTSAICPCARRRRRRPPPPRPAPAAPAERRPAPPRAGSRAGGWRGRLHLSPPGGAGGEEGAAPPRFARGLPAAAAARGGIGPCPSPSAGAAAAAPRRYAPLRPGRLPLGSTPKATASLPQRRRSPLLEPGPGLPPAPRELLREAMAPPVRQRGAAAARAAGAGRGRSESESGTAAATTT